MEYSIIDFADYPKDTHGNINFYQDRNNVTVQCRYPDGSITDMELTDEDQDALYEDEDNGYMPF